MTKMFTKRTKKRSNAMKATAKVLNAVGIKEFSIASCKLKADILELILGILNNKTLEVFDISGNQSGDEMAVVMSKLFQHNRTLTTVFWDSNDITITGLKYPLFWDFRGIIQSSTYLCLYWIVLQF